MNEPRLMKRLLTRRRILFIAALAGAAFVSGGAISAAAYGRALAARSQSQAVNAYSAMYGSAMYGGENAAALWEEVFPDGLPWRAGEGAVPSRYEFAVNVPRAGSYALALEYAPENQIYERNLFDLSVNGAVPDDETSNINLPAFFRFSTGVFEKNSRGNDIYPGQVMLEGRRRVTLGVGEQAYRTDTLLISLGAGTNRLAFSLNEGAATLYSLAITPPDPPPPSYAEYRAAHPGSGAEETVYIEAEKFFYKNKSAIGVVNNASYTASPYSTLAVELNTIDPKTYREHLDTLAYLAEIKTPGYYVLGVKTTMPGKTDSPVFLDIAVDGKIPFAEFKELTLDYRRFMYNHALWEYPVYFDPGVHEITLTLNGGRYQQLGGRLKTIAGEINDLSTALRKITGNNQDPNREWIIEDFLPDMVPAMERWDKTIAEIERELLELSGGKTTEEVNKLRVAVKQLQKLIDKPNKVPYRLTVLSEGERSILQTISQAQLTITAQSLGLDQIILGPGQPVVKENFFFGIAETAKQLAASFKKNQAPKSDPQSIEVWVLRSRQYADALQTLTDEFFTAPGGAAPGIRVNFSLITDQGKLTLANAAGRQPDAAIGVDQYYINDLALRGSLADLREFPGAVDSIRDAAPGALLQMIIDDKLYGIPETQSLHLLYFRTDIFNAFGWKVPETWDEVLLMLPALARNGMNFYIPLASSSAFKNWNATMPFYAQFGAKIYAEGGRGTLIDSDQSIAAMKFMVNLFQIYGMPLQVASFYNDFRSGRIPIGVSDIGEYARLSFSAPEIAGRWDIAPIPGMLNADGVIERWSTCSSKADCVFDASKKKAAAWEFIRWWVSTEAQTAYTRRMQNMYGQEFLWISGNMNALRNLPVPEKHRGAIAAQLEWLQDAPRIPGGYYTEREVSNAFNRIIYDGMDTRSSVDEASTVTNREIRRKMEEFGYIDGQGNVLREYQVPSIEAVKGWLAGGGEI
ncbi:MAG: extracellular solute-binding protein [Treponema sp.]|nr:extracellular solute-binding protein [Treponema sp.]